METMKIEPKVKKDTNKTLESSSSLSVKRGGGVTKKIFYGVLKVVKMMVSYSSVVTYSSVEKVKMKMKKRGMNRVPPIVRPALSEKGNQNQLPEDLAEKGNQNQLPEDLVFEVLVRIEKVKTLHQCKCVSKAWRTIIHDPRFMEAYRRHHRGGLLLFTERKRSLSEWRIPDTITEPFQLFYSTISVDEPEPFFPRVIVPRSNLYKGITQVVDGIVCVYEQTRVFVYNLCTGETMHLPDNNYPAYPGVACNYFLGYDIFIRAYKLLKISAFEIPGSAVVQEWLPYCRLESEILTLGRDSSWRKVATGGTLRILRDGRGHVFSSLYPVLSNGVMYWKTDDLVDWARVVSFDLSKEELRLLKPPQDTLSFLGGRHWRIALFGGRPALYYGGGGSGKRRECLYFCRLDDDGGKGDSWSEHTILIPSGFDSLRNLWCTKVFGNLSTGETLFSDFGNLGSKGFAAISSYDFQKNEFKRLVVGEMTQLSHSVDIVMATRVEENLVPLDVQLSGR